MLVIAFPLTLQVSRKEIAGSCFGLILISLRTSTPFFIMATAIYDITSITQGFLFFPCTNQVLVSSFFDNSHPSSYEVITHGYFGLHFSDE